MITSRILVLSWTETYAVGTRGLKHTIESLPIRNLFQRRFIGAACGGRCPGAASEVLVELFDGTKHSRGIF